MTALTFSSPKGPGTHLLPDRQDNGQHSLPKVELRVLALEPNALNTEPSRPLGTNLYIRKFL